MEEYNLDEAKKQILSKIKREQRIQKSRKYISILKYAAVFIICLSLGYFHFQNNTVSQQEVISKTDISAINDENNIILELDDGTKKIISSDGKEIVVDKKEKTIVEQNGNTLNYSNGKEKIKELIYNTLIVPYGRKFQIVLSDGTKVYLNAGSSLKYPINFLDNKTRNVFLVGEAYFNVAKHKTNHFIVNADDINIKVLGTEFNVSYFPEDTKINTVLVEGSVELYEKENLKSLVKLHPGFIASWHKKRKDIIVEKTDVHIHTAWRNGYLRFKNESFNNILKSLERKFNVVIKNNYKSLGNNTYTASFYDGETVVDILSYFNEETHFTYKFENNKIIINNLKLENLQKN